MTEEDRKVFANLYTESRKREVQDNLKRCEHKIEQQRQCKATVLGFISVTFIEARSAVAGWMRRKLERYQTTDWQETAQFWRWELERTERWLESGTLYPLR